MVSHSLFEVSFYLAQLSFDDLSCSIDICVIVCFTLEVFTRSFAIPNMVLKTQFKLSFLNIFLTQKVLAGTRRVHLLDQLEYRFHCFHRRVGTVVLTAVAFDVAQSIDSWKALLSDGYVGVALIVL